MEDLFVDFTMTVLRINKLIHKIKSHEISKYGLKPVHVMCCYYLYKNPQGLTAKKLGEMSIEDKAAVSRALKTMQNKGYVTYDVNSRNAVVKLTSEGKKISDDICKQIDDAVGAAAMAFTKDEREFFYGALSQIADNLNNYYKEINNND